MALKGLEGVMSSLKKVSDEKAREEVEDVAKRAFQLSLRYCPVDTAELVESGKLVFNKANVKIRYSAKHAARVHEYPDSSIKTGTNPNAKGQWLRVAMIQALNERLKD